MLRASLFSLFLLTAAFPAFAQTNSTSAPTLAPAVPSSNPHIQKAQDKAVEIAKSFTPVEIENLSVIKDGFGIIRAVQVTNKSVSNTVKKCGQDNPEMKAEMDAEYSTWNGRVITTLNNREKDMKTAINDGRFSKPKEVTNFLELIDKAAQYADDKMEKQIISTPSACDSLKESMDDTAGKLETLLTELKFPIAVPKVKEPETWKQPGAHE